MAPPLPHRTALPFRGGTSSNFMEVRTCAPWGASLFCYLKNVSKNCHSLCYKMSLQSSRTEPHFHFAVERVPTSWKFEPVLRFGASLFGAKQFFILVDW